MIETSFLGVPRYVKIVQGRRSGSEKNRAKGHRKAPKEGLKSLKKGTLGVHSSADQKKGICQKRAGAESTRSCEKKLRKIKRRKKRARENNQTLGRILPRKKIQVSLSQSSKLSVNSLGKRKRQERKREKGKDEPTSRRGKPRRPVYPVRSSAILRMGKSQRTDARSRRELKRRNRGGKIYNQGREFSGSTSDIGRIP